MTHPAEDLREKVELPEVVSEGSLEIGGMTLRTYVLTDGRRIINADDVVQFFAGAISDATPEEMANLASLISGGDHA